MATSDVDSTRPPSPPAILVVALLLIMAVAMMAFALGPRTPRASSLPLLASTWGEESSYVAGVQRHSYILAVTPPTTDSFPYRVYLNHSPDFVQQLEYDIRADQANAGGQLDLGTASREFVWTRGTLVEIDTFTKPRPEPGTAMTYLVARWVEQGRAFARAYARELRPVSELISMVESLHTVDRPTFEAQLRDDPRAGRDPKALPHLVGGDTKIQLYFVDWVREYDAGIGTMNIRVPDPGQGPAEQVVNSIAVTAGATPVMIRGHPGVIVRDEGKCGSFIWAEGGAVVSVPSCFGPGELAAINALRTASRDEWKQLIVASLYG